MERDGLVRPGAVFHLEDTTRSQSARSRALETNVCVSRWPLGIVVPVARELLHPLVPDFDDVDFPLAVDGEISRIVELIVTGPEGPPAPQMGSAGAELLDPVVARIRHVEHPVVHLEAHGKVEIARTGAVRTPGGHHRPRSGVLHDPVVAGVGNVDVAAVHADPSGAVEIVPLRDEVSAAAELLDPVVEPIGHIDVAGGVHRRGAGDVEVPGSVTLGTPGHDVRGGL